MTTDIIIPQWNNAKYTVNLLKSIADCTKDYRIILIDNGSELPEFQFMYRELQNHPHFLIQNPENLGFVKGVNQGIASSTSEYIVIQNNDTIVQKGWLEKLTECFSLVKGCGLAGPTTEIASSWQNRDNLPNAWFRQPTREVGGMLAFFSVMISREVITRVGYLSEEFGLGFGDDDDYCERAKAAGYKLVLRTDLTVPHYHRTTFKKYVPDWENEQKKNIALIHKKYPHLK